jgi:hypothetical protein
MQIRVCCWWFFCSMWFLRYFYFLLIYSIIFFNDMQRMIFEVFLLLNVDWYIV